MPNYRTTSCRRQIASLLLGMALMACVLGGTAVVLLEAGHECSGEDCPVCQLVLVTRTSLTFIAKPATLSAVVAFYPLTTAQPRLQAQVMAVADTLVYRKVRLNN